MWCKLKSTGRKHCAHGEFRRRKRSAPDGLRVALRERADVSQAQLEDVTHAALLRILELFAKHRATTRSQSESREDSP